MVCIEVKMGVRSLGGMNVGTGERDKFQPRHKGVAQNDADSTTSLLISVTRHCATDTHYIQQGIGLGATTMPGYANKKIEWLFHLR